MKTATKARRGLLGALLALLVASLGLLGGCSSADDGSGSPPTSCFDRIEAEGGCCPLGSYTRCGGDALSAFYCRTEEDSRKQAAKQQGCSVGLDTTIVCCR